MSNTPTETFIVLYAGKPLVLATGDLLDEAEAHKATAFADYTAAWRAVQQRGLNPQHCQVTSLNKFQKANA
jgi:hypothetical protein